MNDKIKFVLIVFLLILLFMPSIQAKYQTDWLGNVKRVSHGNYSVAEIEGLHTRTDFDADYYYSSQYGEDSPYDALLGIEVFEIDKDEVGVLKDMNFKTNIFDGSNLFEITNNVSMNGITMYSYRDTVLNTYYTYGVCEKEDHSYYMRWDHGGLEIDNNTLKQDAVLFKEILDSIERNE